MDRIFTFSIDNGSISVDYEYNPGHTHGQSKRSNDGKFNFVFVAKNASTEAKLLLAEWQDVNYFDINDPVEHLIILRDPLERWISGVTEFLVGDCSFMGNCNSELGIEEVETLMNSKMFQNLLFNFVIFDGHTLPQCCYLTGIQLSSATFFYYDDTVMQRVMKYADLTNTYSRNSNSSLTSTRKMFIIKKLRELLSGNPALRHTIDKHYYADHKLFDSIKFHN